MGTGRVLMRHWGGYKLGTGRILMRHWEGYKMGTGSVDLLMRHWRGYNMGTAITRMPGERYSRQFRSLVLSSCDAFEHYQFSLFVEITNYRSKLNKPTQSSAQF